MGKKALETGSRALVCTARSGGMSVRAVYWRELPKVTVVKFRHFGSTVESSSKDELAEVLEGTRVVFNCSLGEECLRITEGLAEFMTMNNVA